MRLKKVEITTAPAGILFDFDEVRKHARIDRTDEDAVVSTYLRAAISMLEKATGQILNTTVYTGYLDTWSSEVELGYYPVQSIDSVKYYNTTPTLTTMSASDYYSSLVAYPAKIYFEETYDLRDQIYDNIQIQFTAGYSSIYDLPEELRNAVYIMTTFLYENRGEGKAIPEIVKQLIYDQKVNNWL